MQDKYTGDIGDYVKYALLRLIRKAEGGRLGVAWYLYPDERNGDGGHLEYLDRRRRKDWEHLDKELYWKLKAIVERRARRVASIESDSGILGSNTKFFSKRLTPPQSIARNTVANHQHRKEWRRGWFENLQRKLVDCNVVFVDPDNGLYEIEKFRYGTVGHWKRIPLSEVKTLADSGRTVVVYHHHTLRKGGNIQEINYWLNKLGGSAIAVRSGAWSPRSFFIVNPSKHLTQSVSRFVKMSQKLKLSIHYSQGDDTRNSTTGIDNLIAEGAAQLYEPGTLRLADPEVYRSRIKELCAYAMDDGYSLRPESERGFWNYFGGEPRLRRFELVLIDNGNLRAVWQDDQETHVGLQFLGDDIVQFVIFKRRCPSRPISRVVGRDTASGFKSQIQAFGLQPLLYE